MKTTIKYFYDEDMYDKEPLVMGATLDCNVSEILLISAALHDLKHNEKRNDHDRAYAIKMLDNIKEAMNGKS